jgi:2-keto-4-pentenoate hydratase/2-oxohepta-3-ene-1,7-dioic acid hydratase in catechol pathway
MEADIPSAPVIFLKPSTSLVASNGTVPFPPASLEMHHEVELTVLIGKGGKKIRPSEGLNYVAGYGVGLDMTLRDLQKAAKKQGLPWTLSKGFDASAPASEFVPVKQVPNAANLKLLLKVNGEERQSGTTADMLFSVSELISYASQFMTLEPGDILFTGTPEGVAAVEKGDRLEAELLNDTNEVLTTLNVSII